MSLKFEELESEILGLPANSRALLAEKILASLDELPPEETEQLWIDEAERRLDEVIAGTSESVPAREALNNLRQKLKNAT